MLVSAAEDVIALTALCVATERAMHDVHKLDGGSSCHCAKTYVVCVYVMLIL